MAETALSRSSIEAYSAIILTVITVVFPLTWWLCLLLTLLWEALLIDISLRAKLHPSITPTHRGIAVLFIFTLVSVVGINRASSLWEEAARKDEPSFGAYPHVIFSLQRNGEGNFVPTAKLSAVDGHLINYNVVFVSRYTDHILKIDEENILFTENIDKSFIAGSENPARVANNILGPNVIYIGNTAGSIDEGEYRKIKDGVDFAYFVIMLNFQQKLGQKPYYARFCARLSPPTAVYPCFHPNYVKNESIKSPS